MKLTDIPAGTSRAPSSTASTASTRLSPVRPWMNAGEKRSSACTVPSAAQSSMTSLVILVMSARDLMHGMKNSNFARKSTSERSLPVICILGSSSSRLVSRYIPRLRRNMSSIVAGLMEPSR